MSKEIVKLDEIPEGWKELKGAITAPNGYKWYFNGKSLLSGEFQSALVKEKDIK